MINREVLKSIADEIRNTLLSKISEDDDSITKESIIDYLIETIDAISHISDEDISSVTQTKKAFSNAFKEIAKNGIDSYKHTNSRFEELSEMHLETLDAFSSEQIDIPVFTEKFQTIQNHMVDEITKANSIIAQLSQQVKILESKSNIDSLTKTFNRRALSSYLNKVFENPNLQKNFHIIMIDLDDFKSINDTFGHLAGDKVLIYVSNILRKILRNDDKIFRYGGEEFLITLGNISQKTCYDITSRILKLIRENNLIYKNQLIHVTASIGTTKIKTDDTVDALLNRADGAMYRAKQTGKNKIEMEK